MRGNLFQVRANYSFEAYHSFTCGAGVSKSVKVVGGDERWELYNPSVVCPKMLDDSSESQALGGSGCRAHDLIWPCGANLVSQVLRGNMRRFAIPWGAP